MSQVTFRGVSVDGFGVYTNDVGMPTIQLAANKISIAIRQTTDPYEAFHVATEIARALVPPRTTTASPTHHPICFSLTPSSSEL